MTHFQQHVAKWKGCRRCSLWRGRARVVLARGQLPCDVLFVGEAPGDSEDVLGQPFVGPAGQELDRWVEEALIGGRRASMMPVKIAFTNLVACFPAEQKASGENEPPDATIIACQPRLAELVKIAQPRLIVTVGGLSQEWLGDGRKALRVGVPVVGVTHPAAVLRAPVAQQNLLARRATVTIAQAVSGL